MTSFGWLHLTDLHLGMAGQPGLLPTIKDKFFDDLKSLYEKSSPWDLVVFTGDLTQHGDPDQFKRLDDFLNEMWNKLRVMGCQPSLVAVPGNHDLVRPDARNPAVKLLCKSWDSDKEVRDEFWTNPDSDYRKKITTSFQNYVDWWERTQFKLPVRSGILPGDFSATIEKEGASLGIVGLNTTFLQLTEGDYYGKLSIDSLQFQEVCGGEGPSWIKKHNACLLLTHQPPDWLNKDSQGLLEADIVGNDSFAVHLFGHMHESRYRSQSKGGAPELRVFQGTSFFGMERFGEGKVDRRHGYSAGRIDLDGSEGKLTFWPRTANIGTGQWNFVVDTREIYIDGERTVPKTFPLKKIFERAVIAESLGQNRTVVSEVAAFRKRWAVLVGINEYQFFTKLQYCRQDVIDLAHSFRDILKFEEVIEIHEKAKVLPDRDSILGSLSELRDSGKVESEDLFIFYFSGHGINEGGKDYLLPIGARPRDVKLLGIRVEELVELLKAFACKNTLMFIDACREAVAGARGSAAIGADTNAVVSKAGIVTFFSCSPDDRSYEIDALNHGSFTYSILQAIQEGIVSTVSDLDRYLQQNVPNINRDNGKPTQFPYAIICPPSSANLSILFNDSNPVGAAQKYRHLIKKLTPISAGGFITQEIFISAVAFLGRISDKVELDAKEQMKLGYIVALCDGVWEPAAFSTVWQEIDRRQPPGPQIRKPDRLK